jgi:hypothetical protein
MVGLPIIWPHGLCVALAALPFLRRGDRAAAQDGWRDAVQPRTLVVSLAVVMGAALAIALLLPGPISQLMEWASSGLFPT